MEVYMSRLSVNQVHYLKLLTFWFMYNRSFILGGVVTPTFSEHITRLTRYIKRKIFQKFAAFVINIYKE